MHQTLAETAVRATIENLILAGTTSNLDDLDRIYHDDMTIHMIDTDENFSEFDKPAFMNLLAEMVRGSGSANKWAHYNAIHADDRRAHVVITRKVELGGQDRILVLSIDLVHENERWQVIREVIFARPNPETTPQ